jgi:two-component system probable response regulator PhcQ
MVQRERDQLLQEKMSVLHNLMIADRIVSLGLLAAGLSHHIRNSLVAVKTFLDLAPAKLKEETLDADGLRNPDFWKDYYQKVQGQIGKVNNLLNDLWQASETPKFQFADRVVVHDIIAGVLDTHAPQFAKRNITVLNNVPGTLPELQVDKLKFIRLFELLFKDELASLPDGTQITVSGESHPEADTAAPEVVLRIQDNGPGLPEEALRLVFDPFALRTESPLEYGINLMACYFIVHHHGGKIEAVSGKDTGTIFTLRLPINPNQQMQPMPDQDFFQKVLLNDSLWEKLLTAD